VELNLRTETFVKGEEIPMTTVTAALEAAVSHHQAGELDQAEHLCRLIIRIDPKHPDALYLLGVSAYRRGRTEDAAELINQAIAESDDAAPFYCKLGGVHRKLLRIDDAIENYEAAVRISPDCAEAHFSIGEIYFESGNLDEARRWLAQGLKLEPTDLEARIKLADLLMAQRDFSEAIHQYQQAVPLKPDWGSIHSKLAEASLLNEQLDEAIEYHQAAIRLDPEAVTVRHSWGRVLNELVKVDTLSQNIHSDAKTEDETSQRNLRPNEALTIRRDLAEAIRAFEQSFALQKQAENVLNHVVGSIEQANNINDPSPHLSLENVFPNGVYHELIENLPDDEYYEHRRFQPTESKEMESDYRAFSLDEQSLKRLPEPLEKFWTRYAALFSSKRIGWALFPHFQREISSDPNLFLIRSLTVDPCFAIPDIPHNAIVVCIRLSREIVPNTGIVFECFGADRPVQEQGDFFQDRMDSLMVVFGGRNS
jgi:tetratricopeptide (TPR) repeat protein